MTTPADDRTLTIGINGRDFTAAAFADLIRPRPGELVDETARRIARAIGVGCMATWTMTPDPDPRTERS